MKRALAVIIACVAAVAAQGGEVASAAIPACPYARPGPTIGAPQKPIGRLIIGSIGLSTYLYRGRSDEMTEALSRGPAIYPGFRPYGSLPGQGRVVGIAGHRTTHRYPFCLLDRVPVGEFIVAKMNYGTFTYRVVRKKVVRDDDWSPFTSPWSSDPWAEDRSGNQEYLVAAACTPPHYDSHRIVLIARLVKRS